MEYTSELEKKYKEEVVPAIRKKLKIKNDLALPTVEKIVVNAGIGSEYRNNSNIVDEMVEIITTITGQKPIVTESRIAVANFKLRAGMPNGVKVTLRGPKMWDFLYKLLYVALPRVRDFRGVSRKSFDGQGNYSLGIREHTIFPEIDTSTVTKLRPMQVVIRTSADSNEAGEVLLEELGMPFEKKE